MMRRTLHIGIASPQYVHQRMREIAKGGPKGPNEPRVWFTSYEALARVFSRQNIMLIEILREFEPESVTELANKVGREKTNVLRSLKTLKEFDIVEFQEGEGGRKPPRLKYHAFQSTFYPRKVA